MSKPKILYWDIETSPNEVYSWSLWVNGMLHHDNIQRERVIICASWMWEGENTVHQVAIDPDDPWDDGFVVETLHKVMHEADAIVHHNGDKFDMRWLNARVCHYGMSPLPPLVQIDTKKAAKKYFYFNSNRLDYLAKFFGLGAKIHTEFSLWKECMQGSEDALRKMLKYNARDVRLLKKVYKYLAPYLPAKFNLRLLSDRAQCPSCGSSKIQYRGYVYKATRKYRRFQCTKCGNWSHERKSIKE